MKEYEKLISRILTDYNSNKIEIMKFFVRYIDITIDNKVINNPSISIKQMRDAIEKFHPEYLALFDNVILLK
jgi:hypothetical protein